MSEFQEKMDEFEGNSAWGLSTWADVSAPLHNDSPGGEFLQDVVSRCIEQAQSIFGEVCDEYIDAETFESKMEDVAYEAIDGMSQLIYTADKWQVFTDLGLWDETPDLGGETMDDMATGVVFQVGHRLFGAVAACFREALEDDRSNVDEVRDTLIERLEERGREDLAEIVAEWNDRRVLHLIEEDGDTDPVLYILTQELGLDEEDED